MLKQKRGNDGWKPKVATVHRRSEYHAREREGRRIGLQHALDVPLAVYFGEASFDLLRVLPIVRQPAPEFAGEAVVDLWRGVPHHAVGR